MEKIEIYNSRDIKYKVMLPLFILTIVTVLQFYRHWLDRFWLIMTLIYIVYWIVFIARTFFTKNKIMLEITEDGIDDRYRKRLIKWSDVYNLTLATGAVVVILHHPEAVRANTWWGKIRYWYNNLRYGSAVLINTDVLKGKELDNYNILYDYMEKVERKTAI